MSSLDLEELSLLATRERQLLRVILITFAGIILLGLLNAGIKFSANLLWVRSGPPLWHSS